MAELQICMDRFVKEFNRFGVDLQKSCVDLRRIVDGPPVTHMSGMDLSLTKDLRAQIRTLEKTMSSLQALTVANVPFAELHRLGSSLYSCNEAGIDKLETQLEQYGYTRGTFPSMPPPSEPSTLLAGTSSKPGPASLRASHDGPPGGMTGLSMLAGLGTTLAVAEVAAYPAGGEGEGEALGHLEDGLGDDNEDVHAKKMSLSPLMMTLEDLGISNHSIAAIASCGQREPLLSTNMAPLCGLSATGNSAAPAYHLPCSPHTPLAHLGASALGDENVPSLANVTYGDLTAPPCKHPGDGGAATGCAETPYAGDGVQGALAEPITKEEFDSVPSFLRMQLSVESVNEAIGRVNDFITEKRFSLDEQGRSRARSHVDTIRLDELECLKLGAKVKNYVLLLVRLNRLVTQYCDGETAYKVVGPTLVSA
eukprot:jgi/Mesvir1/1845/Mv06946-RA.1